MYNFFAYISRMKLIERWSLMRSVQRENVQEHSLQVAVVAHALAVIKNLHFGGQINVERTALLAIYHDATEVMTGDLPTPVKYFSSPIREAYKALEGHAAGQLLTLLPESMKPAYKPLLQPDPQDQECWKLVKAADSICALTKCLEERSAGNLEFSRAQKSIEAKLQEDIQKLPEVQFFVDQFIPGFSLTLDEISRPLEI